MSKKNSVDAKLLTAQEFLNVEDISDGLLYGRDGYIFGFLSVRAGDNDRPARVIYNTTSEDWPMMRLVADALRYDPAIIVPAEVRDGAAFAAASAGQTGHTILTSFHANNARDAYKRLTTLCNTANTGLPNETLLEISTHTFSNVTAAHSISATFKANGRISISSVTLTDSLGFDLNGHTIKSGYGFFAGVDTTSSGVTDIRVVMSYDFGDGSQTVTLQEKQGGTYQFPVNAASPTDACCIYIPVATADGIYTVTVTMTAINAAGEPLTETATAQITVQGNMYEDDFTGNSGQR